LNIFKRKRFEVLSIKLNASRELPFWMFSQHLRFLEILSVENFSGSLSELQPCQKLVELVLEVCCETLHTGSLARLPHLKFLHLISSIDLNKGEWDLSGLRFCKKLQRLKIYQCSSLESLDEIFGLENGVQCEDSLDPGCPSKSQTLGITTHANSNPWSTLEELEVKFCRRLNSAEGIHACTGLRVLALTYTKITNLDIRALKHLTALDVSRCRLLEGPIRGLGAEGSCGLQDLKLPNCRDYGNQLAQEECLEFLPKLEQIIYLDLSDCKWLLDITAVGACRILKHLRLKNTPVSNIQPLGRATNLRLLDLAFCCLVVSLDGLQNLLLLEFLNVSGCHLEDLSPLICCSNLKTLDLTAAKAPSFQILVNCQNLEILDLSETGVSNEDMLELCSRIIGLRSFFVPSSTDLEMFPKEVSSKMKKYSCFPLSEWSNTASSSDDESLSVSEDSDESSDDDY